MDLGAMGPFERATVGWRTVVVPSFATWPEA